MTLSAATSEGTRTVRPFAGSLQMLHRIIKIDNLLIKSNVVVMVGLAWPPVVCENYYLLLIHHRSP